MKNKKTCLLYTMLSIVLIGCLTNMIALNNTALSMIETENSNIGDVRFDAIIELNHYSPDSLRQDYTMMFARYWVTRDYYSAAILWAEPQSTDLFFATNLPSLSFVSDEQDFNIHHETFTRFNKTYKKPFFKRGVFRCMFGGYPIDNIRFAEREALAERLYTDDLKVLEDSNQTDVKVLDMSILSTEGGCTRDISQLKIQKNGDRIDSMQLFNLDNRLLKDIKYEYESKEGNTRLCKLTAKLPERAMMVGFKGEGMKVTLDGKEYQYRDLQAKHHTGGRTCTVEYEPVKLGDKNINLPVKVTVCSRKDGRILRCVRMMNFKRVELDAAGVEEAARRFGGFTSDQHEYEQFRIKYWNKNLDEIEKKDAKSIKQLRGRLEKTLVAEGNSTGEKLKNLNALIELNRIIGDESEIERHYQNYLSTLSENELPQMILVGGYGVIETSMFRQQRSEAEKLLGLWVDAVLEFSDDESILLFARSQLAKNRLWTTMKLLEALLSKKNCSTNVRFEAQALRCIALDKLSKLLCSDDIAKKGLIAEIQANWVAYIGKENLEAMLAKSKNQASQSFTKLSEPTESQQALKAQLDQIDEEINQAKKLDIIQ